MNSIENTSATAHNTTLLPPISSPTNSAPIKRNVVNNEVVNNEEADAPLFAQLLAGMIPLLGFFMAGLVYGKSPKRCNQIWKITLWSFLIQLLVVVFVIGGFLLLFTLIGFHGYC